MNLQPWTIPKTKGAGESSREVTSRVPTPQTQILPRKPLFDQHIFSAVSQALCWALEMNKLEVAPALMELIYSLREEVE